METLASYEISFSVTVTHKDIDFEDISIQLDVHCY